MLEMDPNKRISCKEALSHKYFGDTHHPKILDSKEYFITILILIIL